MSSAAAIDFDEQWGDSPKQTSAAGPMRALAPVLLILGSFQGTATGDVPFSIDDRPVVPYLSTTTGATEAREQSTNRAVLELRRLSGLTWDELALALGVSRRTLHLWASGRPISAANEQHLLRMLAVVNRIDRGTARRNRELLLSPAPDGSRLLLDLLSGGQFDAVTAMAGRGEARRAGAWPKPSPSVLKARRPPHPVDLIASLEDDPERSSGSYVPALSRRIK